MWLRATLRACILHNKIAGTTMAPRAWLLFLLPPHLFSDFAGSFHNTSLIPPFTISNPTEAWSWIPITRLTYSCLYSALPQEICWELTDHSEDKIAPLSKHEELSSDLSIHVKILVMTPYAPGTPPSTTGDIWERISGVWTPLMSLELDLWDSFHLYILTILVLM